MPRLAKYLSAHRERPFASLRVTTLYRCWLVNFIIGQLEVWRFQNAKTATGPRQIPMRIGGKSDHLTGRGMVTNDFWMGIPIVVVALISFALFFSSLIASLRATGVVLSQPQLPQAPVSYQPQAPAAYQSDLDRTLSTLAAALAADLSARRQASSDQQGDQQLTSRREAQ